MRILDRYIVREVFRHALLGLVVFTFVFFVPQLIRLMELFVRHSGSGAQVLKLFLCIFPAVFVFTVPMATLIGVLLGLGRMSADSPHGFGHRPPPNSASRWSAGAYRRGGDSGNDDLARTVGPADISFPAGRLDHLTGLLCVAAASLR